MRTFFGVLCFGIGLACSVSAIDGLIRPWRNTDPSMSAFFAGVFLLGSLFLLRRRKANDARTDAVGNEEQGRNQEKITRLLWGNTPPQTKTLVARLTWGLIVAAAAAWLWFNAR